MAMIFCHGMLGVRESSILRDLSRSFAYDLDVLDQRQNQLPIGLKIIANPALRERSGLTSSFKHVSQPNLVIPVHIALPLRPAPPV